MDAVTPLPPAPPAVAPPRRAVPRDAVVLLALGVALLGAALLPDRVRGPAPLLLAVFAGLAGLTWAEELVRSWAVGDGWVAARGWTGWRRLGVDDVRSVSLADADPFGETLLFTGRRLRTVAVPLRPARADEGFRSAVARLVDGCSSRGTVDPAVRAVLARHPMATAGRPPT